MNRDPRRWLVALVALGLCGLGACDPKETPAPPPGPSAEPSRPSPAPASAPEASHFAIRMGGKLVGFADVTGPTPVEGRPALRVSGESGIYVAVMGKAKAVNSSSTFEVAADTGQVTAYEGALQVGETKTRVHATTEGGKLRLRSEVVGVSEPREVSFDVPDGGLELSVGNDVALLVTFARFTTVAPGEKRPLASVSGVSLTRDDYDVVGLPAAEVTVDGEARPAEVVSIDGQATVFIEPKTRALLRVEMIDGRTVIERTTASVRDQVDTSGPASLSSDAFASRVIRSSVVFPDFSVVERFEAKVEGDVQTAEGGLIRMEGPMQRFEGAVEGTRVKGTVRIDMTPYDGAGAWPLPVPAAVAQGELAAYVSRSPFIESDDPDIIAHAATLTEGATTVWEATQRVASWVAKNIAYVPADTPSAKLALHTKTGDCGPHASLTTALLRARGIPARLVGGLLYAPAFGGAFGQHAWVEVYVSEGRWVPIDPTTGEVERMSALHVKFFEGMGGVIPHALEIVDYFPQAEGPSPLVDRPFPWEAGRTYTWVYTLDGEEAGTETVVFEKAAAPAAWTARSHTVFTAAGTTRDVTREVTLDAAGNPLSWKTEGKVGAASYGIAGTFADGTFTAHIRKPDGTELDHAIPLGEARNAFENLCMLSWMLACRRVAYTPGETHTYPMIHLESMQPAPLGFQVGDAPRKVAAGGAELSVHAVQVTPFQNTFLVDRTTGRFLGLDAPGGLAVRLR